MKEYLVFGPGILSQSNTQEIAAFAQKYGYEVIQLGQDRLPVGKYIFFDKNAKAVRQMKDECKLAYTIGESLDDFTITGALNDISSKKRRQTSHTFFNGQADRTVQKDTDPLLAERSNDCCRIL